MDQIVSGFGHQRLGEPDPAQGLRLVGRETVEPLEEGPEVDTGGVDPLV